MAKEVSVNWFLDKTFEVLEPMDLYKGVDSSGNPSDFIRELQPGEHIRIDSYLDRMSETGNVWFGIYDPINHKTAFFKYPGPNSLKYLQNYEGYTPVDHSVDVNFQNGLKNVFVKPLIKWGLIGLLGVTAIKEGFKLLGKKVE